jgi:hypothetical protein
MRPGHAEEGGEAGPQVVECGFPGQPVAERGHPRTDLNVGAPEPVLVLLNDTGNPNADRRPRADAVIIYAVVELHLPGWSPKVFVTGRHEHPAFLSRSIQSSIVEWSVKSTCLRGAALAGTLGDRDETGVGAEGRAADSEAADMRNRQA